MQSIFFAMLFNEVVKMKWWKLLFLFLLFFVGAWSLLCYIEPLNPMIESSIFWWYFTNNVLRGVESGYAPVTLAGRIVCFVCYAIGGLLFLVILAKIYRGTKEYSERKKKGLMQLNLKGHIVLLGYQENQSKLVIQQTQAGKPGAQKIVLCSRHLQENPWPDLVDFVAGNTASEDVMVKACVKDAAVVAIHGHTDERALAIAVMANAYAGPQTHILVYLENEGNKILVEKVNPRITPVTSLRTMLIAQEIINPGSSGFLRSLASFEDPCTLYRLNIPHSFVGMKFGDLHIVLYEKYGIVLTASADSWDHSAKLSYGRDKTLMVRGGMSVFYISDGPPEDTIDWDSLEAPCELSVERV